MSAAFKSHDCVSFILLVMPHFNSVKYLNTLSVKSRQKNSGESFLSLLINAAYANVVINGQTSIVWLVKIIYKIMSYF